MAANPLDPVNGYTVKEMIALVLLPEVQGIRVDTNKLKTEVAGLTSTQGVIVERLDHVVVPENCPISHDVERLQIAIRDSSHEGKANTNFRIQTKAIFAAAIFAISTVSGMIAVFLAHVLG